MENDYRDLISRNIVQDMMEGVLAIRFDGTISYVNNAAEKILGRLLPYFAPMAVSTSLFTMPSTPCPPSGPHAIIFVPNSA